ncbi:hypothetical protein ABPG77_003212 [Micractinium sp. CCAP 211/92]
MMIKARPHLPVLTRRHNMAPPKPSTGILLAVALLALGIGPAHAVHEASLELLYADSLYAAIARAKLTYLQQAIDAAGLTDILTNSSLDATLLAPTNRAFRRLFDENCQLVVRKDDHDDWEWKHDDDHSWEDDSHKDDEHASWQDSHVSDDSWDDHEDDWEDHHRRLLSAAGARRRAAALCFEALLADAELLAQVLQYHVLPGVVNTTTWPADGGKETVPTLLEGTTLELRKSAKVRTFGEEFKDYKIVGARSDAKIVLGDLPAGSGLIHLIDDVLLP